jgi:hypothetical protein
MPRIGKTNDIQKPLAQWSNRDFLLYYSNRLAEATGQGVRLEDSVAWQAFTGRIKGFRTKLNLDPRRYKEFIDKVFDVFFKLDDHVPVFGAIVSERVFHIVTTYLRDAHPMYSDFEKLRKELYANNLWFQKLTKQGDV